MVKLQDFIRDYGETVIKQLTLMPVGWAHLDSWVTNLREDYASAEDACIMSYLYRKGHDIKYLKYFSGLLKRNILLLKRKDSNIGLFSKVFIFHYSIMAILILPDDERKMYIDMTQNEFTAYKDKCHTINTNCAILQYGNEIFLSCMNPKRRNILYLNQLLTHIENSQNVLGFINDSCSEGEQPADGMPIAYHMFCCYLLLDVLLADKNFHVLPASHREKIENIITAGMKWLSYAASDAGDVAMAERSRYQLFTMGIQAALTAISRPKQVEKILEQLLYQYGLDGDVLCCTPNGFPANMRVGFESYTRSNDFNGLNMVGFITADLCLDAGILLFQDERMGNTGLFTDADSGYAFYRNKYGFVAITLRNHAGGYLAQGSGFHYRLNNYRLPLADPRDNVVDAISEAIKIKGEGGVFFSSENARIEEINDGVQIQYGNDSLEIKKKIHISEKKIEWNYGISSKGEKKLSECQIILSVPLIVNDGKSVLKIVDEISHGVIFQWHDLYYVLKYDNAKKGMLGTKLSLDSVSGVSTNFEIVLTPNDRYMGSSVELILIQKEEINNYKDIESGDTENESLIDITRGMLKDCTGCGVCVGVCPQKCIGMQTDHAGFRYPVIDKEICTGCNVCNNKCPINSRPVVNAYTRPFVYAAYSSDTVNRKASSSGGIFREFTKTIMENGGMAFAAKYNPFPTVAFSKIDSVDEISFFHGSKYVESEIGDVFIEVKKELDTNRKVLFVGLPCQIAGLLSFLHEPYTNLYTIDLVCGGVPSSLYFRTWIDSLENIYQDKIIDYKFRNKILGWSNSISSITFSSGNERFITKKKDIFYQDYQKGKNVRKGCFNCQFYGFNTVADLTIGDYNGALHYEWAREDADRGLSVICINSEKGNELVQICKKNIVLKESNFYAASRYNFQMKMSRVEPEEREKYLKDIGLFEEKIYSDFNPDMLCFCKVENPCEEVSVHTPIKWTVQAQGTKEVEYAWYLYYNDKKIDMVWYGEKNTFEYIPETAGEYYVIVYAKYKDNQDKIALKLQKVIVK